MPSAGRGRSGRRGRRPRSRPPARAPLHLVRGSRPPASTMRSFMRCIGLWMPGVSKRTICPSGRLTTARMRLRVVWGLSETMATFWPTRSVDQRRLADVRAGPRRSRSRTEARPPARSCRSGGRRRKRTRLTRLRSASTTSSMKPRYSMLLARPRDAAEGRRHQPAHRAHVARRPATASSACSSRSRFTRPGDQHRAVGLDADRLGLHVVLVLDLADQLLDDVLDRHQPGGAAVLVDHDGEGGALGLQLLQQLGDLLGLGHQVRPRAPAACSGSSGAPSWSSRSRTSTTPDDVVEVLAVDRDPAVLASPASRGAARRRWRWPRSRRCRGAASSRRAPGSRRSAPASPPAAPRPGRAPAAAAPPAPRRRRCSPSSARGRSGGAACAARAPGAAGRGRRGRKDGSSTQQRALGVAPHQA